MKHPNMRKEINDKIYSIAFRYSFNFRSDKLPSIKGGPMPTPKTADIIIVGGGVMGASTVYHLAERGVKDIVLLEKEEFFGQGATGRCAGGVGWAIRPDGEHSHH